MLHSREGLQLCEHDSMVWIYFCLLEILMLYIVFLHMWVRGERGAESVSFDNESFGDFSEVRHHVRDLTLGDLVFCGGVYNFAELGLTRAEGGR